MSKVPRPASCRPWEHSCSESAVPQFRKTNRCPGRRACTCRSSRSACSKSHPHSCSNRPWCSPPSRRHTGLRSTAWRLSSSRRTCCTTKDTDRCHSSRERLACTRPCKLPTMHSSRSKYGRAGGSTSTAGSPCLDLRRGPRPPSWLLSPCTSSLRHPSASGLCRAHSSGGTASRSRQPARSTDGRGWSSKCLRCNSASRWRRWRQRSPRIHQPRGSTMRRGPPSRHGSWPAQHPRGQRQRGRGRPCDRGCSSSSWPRRSRSPRRSSRRRPCHTRWYGPP
mmetsp:Transcript_96900/g.278308  ORF Transcript_96900/g.278308 Transcript_96900/m.278308 type:complete len:279 (+) Transcript_96900:959-1795(+)